ncbi:MAG: benzoate-CoA ligase family protein [Burkholderiaceae bacterium]|nr:MAG: benzoate-CoA ligase family protein [Burkholderiaceae bacterium]
MYSYSTPLQGNIVDYLFEHSLGSGLRTRAFLTTPDGDVTFEQTYARICQVGNLLKALGVQPGDRVLFSVLDGSDFVGLFLGGIKVGAVSLPINTFLTTQDYGYYLRDSAAKVAVVDQSIAPLILEAHKAQPLSARILVIGPNTYGFESFEDAVRDQPSSVTTHACAPDDVAFWLYSSGSTGAPKGVVHTHAHLQASCELFGRNTLNLSSDDVVICPPKMFFAYGLGFQVYMALRAGARVITDPSPARPAQILELIMKHHPTLLVAVPTLFAGLLDKLRNVDKDDIAQAFSRLRFCVSGGEVLAPSVIQGWKDVTGSDILDGVGTTEMTHMFVINRPEHVVPGSCGQVVDGYTVRLVDDDWKDVPQGEIGNMFAIGPSAAQQYWNKPEKTASTMRGGGVLTGDKFYQDKNGNYFYVGRNDDMLRAGGIWVSPAEIESTLLEHPDISECAVIGVEDDSRLVKPKAYVVLRSEVVAGPELEEAIRQVVRSRLAHYKCPRWIQFVDSLPKTATGKIQRFKLRQMEQRVVVDGDVVVRQRA